MSVYKEGYHAIELIKKKSVQIYADACDFGAPIKIGDELWNWVKQLADWYKVEGTREAGSWGVSITVELMDEWNTGAEERFRVTYCRTKIGECKGFDGFVNVVRI